MTGRNGNRRRDILVDDEELFQFYDQRVGTNTSVSKVAKSTANPRATANCDPGEIVIKFSHVTNTDKHPKGIAASLLEKRVNDSRAAKDWANAD
ncbi:hypothetical protein SC81_22680, partial [Vibrio vulnificus]|uniref:DUF3418 domain-containing protein n=1 Tax=Vibrio vulnificus TaxID=672 RepID=UPI000CA8C71F